MSTATERTKVRRKPQRGSHERATIDAILDAALMCHVGFVAEHGPVVIPTTFVRIRDRVYLHGSSTNHMLRTLATGIDVCVAVSLLDELVLARTAFHHSVNYRSVMLFGRAMLIDDAGAKLEALAALLDRIVPNRSRSCRPPNAKELAATLVVAVPIAEASAKTRSGPPLPDDGEDADLPYWAGTIPLLTSRGTPVSAPGVVVPPNL